MKADNLPLQPRLAALPVPDDSQALWCLETARPRAVQATRRYACGVKIALEVEGYAFSWGSVAERQEPGLLVWEKLGKSGKIWEIGKKSGKIQKKSGISHYNNT